MKVFNRKMAYQRNSILLMMAGLMGVCALIALVCYILYPNHMTKSLLVLFTYSVVFHGVLYFLNNQFQKLGIKSIQLFNAFIYSIFTIIALYNPFDFPYLWAYLLYFPIIIGLIENEMNYKVWSGFYIVLYTSFLINNRENSLFTIVFILFAILSILLGYMMVKYLSFVRDLYSENNAKQMKEHIFQTLSMLIPIVEAKSHTTKNEIMEMTALMKGVAHKLPHLDVKDWEMELLSLLHFVSRIEWPDYIFEKQGDLTEYEWRIVKNHCLFGWHLLGDFQSFENVREAFLRHHQRLDGTGYPEYRPGTKIPKLAQVLGLAEAFTAMIYPRVYHDSHTREEALAEIQKQEKDRVEPEILKAFEEIILLDVS